MRCYHFSNMYLSSIQVGIQAAHCQMELFLKYDLSSAGAAKMLYDWAYNHKTMICLNAGYDVRLREIAEYMDSKDNHYPWSKFHESEEAMGGMLTNVAIVLPEEIYEGAKTFKKFPMSPDLMQFSSWELGLMEILNSCGLAR